MNFVVFAFLFITRMTSFNIGSLNINSCRDGEKRAALVEYLQLKKDGYNFITRDI